MRSVGAICWRAPQLIRQLSRFTVRPALFAGAVLVCSGRSAVRWGADVTEFGEPIWSITAIALFCSNRRLDRRYSSTLALALYCRGGELPHSESRATRAPGQPVPPLNFSPRVARDPAGRECGTQRRNHHSEVSVEGAVLLRLYGAGEEEKEPLRLASRLFDIPALLERCRPFQYETTWFVL